MAISNDAEQDFLMNRVLGSMKPLKHGGLNARWEEVTKGSFYSGWYPKKECAVHIDKKHTYLMLVFFLETPVTKISLVNTSMFLEKNGLTCLDCAMPASGNPFIVDATNLVQGKNTPNFEGGDIYGRADVPHPQNFVFTDETAGTAIGYVGTANGPDAPVVTRDVKYRDFKGVELFLFGDEETNTASVGCVRFSFSKCNFYTEENLEIYIPDIKQIIKYNLFSQTLKRVRKTIDSKTERSNKRSVNHVLKIDWAYNIVGFNSQTPSDISALRDRVDLPALVAKRDIARNITRCIVGEEYQHLTLSKDYVATILNEKDIKPIIVAVAGVLYRQVGLDHEIHNYCEGFSLGVVKCAENAGCDVVTWFLDNCLDHLTKPVFNKQVNEYGLNYVSSGNIMNTIQVSHKKSRRG